MSTDIVIVNWNAGDLLLRCVQSILQEANRQYLGKVIVVDNNSADNSITIVPKDEKMCLIKNRENLGFAKACNQGFRQCKSNYVLLLNPDALLGTHTLEQCDLFMNDHNDIDVMGVALLNENGRVSPSCARFPTSMHIFFDASGLSKLWPGIFTPGTLMTDWDHAESKVVDQVMGAFMFMRRSVFDRFGYFDERYFVYFEELDYSKKIVSGGGISYYNKDIRITHSGGGTTNTVKAFRLFLFLESRMKYALKHFSKSGYWFVCFSTWLVEPISRFLLALIKGRFAEVRAVIGAYKLLVKNKFDKQK